MAASAVVAGKQPVKTKSPRRSAPKAGQETTTGGTESENHSSNSSSSSTPKNTKMAQSSPGGRSAGGTEDTTGDAMEEALPILPKGFVENTVEIYAEVASYDVVPPERLKEYWRVYTITHRKLSDPTASRLESFWWHVWGSNRSKLSGKTLAKLYENISNGETFVPLRGPPNRYEGPSIPLVLRQLMAHEAAVQAAERSPAVKGANRSSGSSTSQKGSHGAESSSRGSSKPSSAGGQNDDGDGRNDNDYDDDDEHECADKGLSGADSKEALQEARLKQLSSSSTRPPPSQSILKKPRPLLSGPRPTPRFALPSANPSEDDDDGGHETSASASDNTVASSTASGSSSGKPHSKKRVVSSSSQQDRVKSQSPKSGPKSPRLKHGKKKFVVSSSSSKRKAHLPKHAGSQSSAGSESSIGTRETASSRQTIQTSYSDNVLIEEDEEDDQDKAEPRPSQQSRSSIQPQVQAQTQQFSKPPTKSSNPMSSKAAGKQPVRPSITTTGQQQQQQQQHSASPASSSSVASVNLSGIPVAPAAAMRSQRPQFVRQQSGGPPSMSSGSVASSTGSGMLEMPMVSRNRPSTSRPGILSRHLDRDSSGLDIGRGSATTAPISFGRSPVTTSRLSQTTGSSTMSGSPHSLAGLPPRLFRSFSQDGYSQQQSGDVTPNAAVHQVMSSASIAAPSTVAVSAVFSEVEGPDPIDIYRSTGFDEDEPPLSRTAPEDPVYNEHNTVSRQAFTPTRPTPTPRIPFARTRSQLNIILDREKERLGEGSFASWRGSRGSRDHQDSHRDRQDN